MSFIEMKITTATADDLPAVRELFHEYWTALGFTPCFEGFEQELATLPGAYAVPHGRILLALRGADAVGCVALRPFDEFVCEMKRLYVRPAARGERLGRRLAEAIAAEARGIGYQRMRLTTLPIMAAAISVYESLGFRPIEPYTDHPPGTKFLELRLH